MFILVMEILMLCYAKLSSAPIIPRQCFLPQLGPHSIPLPFNVKNFFFCFRIPFFLLPQFKTLCNSSTSSYPPTTGGEYKFMAFYILGQFIKASCHD